MDFGFGFVLVWMDGCECGLEVDAGGSESGQESSSVRVREWARLITRARSRRAKLEREDGCLRI